jgi:hypothetical protein
MASPPGRLDLPLKTGKNLVMLLILGVLQGTTGEKLNYLEQPRLNFRAAHKQEILVPLSCQKIQ